MSRLFIVSNRLPLTIEQNENGQHVFRQSSGGLVSAITAFLENNSNSHFEKIFWAGAPGCTSKIWESTYNADEDNTYGYLPVFLAKRTYEQYYNGFSNSLLWPLFHYFPSYADYNTVSHDAYVDVNAAFAIALSQQINPDDVLWIHDYHLLPLAAMMRNRFPSLTIGLFLHIPFPAYEIFRVLPKDWQHELLEGMLGADLIGFHTIDYAMHFLNCVQKVLSLKPDGQRVTVGNRQVTADAFPISIDFDQFNAAYSDPAVTKLRKNYEKLKSDRSMIFSVDRLDYTKGISNRLRGYEQFLNDYPEYRGKVIFVLSIVPSRDSISRYAERKKMIDEYIGNLNSRLGSIAWQPVIYQYAHLSFHELVALYTACDLALITPLRDGMNLVSKEFVASRADKRGVLVLSEMAGAARELSEALLINPNDTREMATMIKYGLEMPAHEQAERLAAMQDRIRSYDVVAWSVDFFRKLFSVKARQMKYGVKFLDDSARLQLTNAYKKSKKRLFLLDYDGSLIPFSRLPSLAIPTPEVMNTLTELAEDKANEVYIISGRDSNILETWFGKLNIGLIAEHGAKIRKPGREWHTEVRADVTAWMDEVNMIMTNYVARCPHSFIEQKDFSLAWHYRNSESTQGMVRARELLAELREYAETRALNVLDGHKVIEVRTNSINKGTAAEKIARNKAYDFVFAIGDDTTDEDMFKKLADIANVYTIKIGGDASFARYNLQGPDQVRSLLSDMLVATSIAN